MSLGDAVFSRDLGLVFANGPSGVHAVDVGCGRTLWTSAAIRAPGIVVNNQLVTNRTTTGLGVVVDAATGAVIRELSGSVPSPARVVDIRGARVRLAWKVERQLEWGKGVAPPEGWTGYSAEGGSTMLDLTTGAVDVTTDWGSGDGLDKRLLPWGKRPSERGPEDPFEIEGGKLTVRTKPAPPESISFVVTWRTSGGAPRSTTLLTAPTRRLNAIGGSYLDTSADGRHTHIVTCDRDGDPFKTQLDGCSSLVFDNLNGVELVRRPASRPFGTYVITGNVIVVRGRSTTERPLGNERRELIEVDRLMALDLATNAAVWEHVISRSVRTVDPPPN